MTTRFSYWTRHHRIYDVYEQEFLRWINGRTDLLKGKKVLDGGCGMARNSIFCAKHGATQVCALEINEQVVPVAQRNAAPFDNIKVCQADIQSFDSREIANSFDTVICIGVLHHLPQPTQALKRFRECLKDGGHLIAMVYSYEGNESLLRFLLPARVITSKLPLWLLECLAFPVTLIYKAILPLLRGPYFELQRISPLMALQNNIVDQLCPDIAHYWTRSDVEMLFSPMFEIKELLQPNGRTWTVVAEKR